MTIHNIDGKNRQAKVYSWKSGTVSVAGATANTDITTISAFADLFTPFGSRKPYKVKVLATGATYLKINEGDVITVDATAPFEAEDLIIDSIKVSSGGTGVTVTVYLQ